MSTINISNNILPDINRNIYRYICTIIGKIKEGMPSLPNPPLMTT